ncbi:glutathione reductase [Haematococcus lacustris]
MASRTMLSRAQHAPLTSIAGGRAHCITVPKRPASRAMATSEANGDHDADLFVIGAGSGGTRAARIAAQKGARVIVAELPFGGVGGCCVLRGCVPKKLMLQAAMHGPGFDQAHAFGWRLPQSVQPQFDWAAFQDAKRTELQRLSNLYRSNLQKAGAQILEGSARLVEPQVVEVNGKHYKARHVLIATGSQSVVPEFPGSHLCATSDTLLDAARQPRSIAVVGSGYIGCEQSGILARLGAATHLVFRQKMPLKGNDEEVRSFVSAQLQHHGIRLHPCSDIVEVRQQQRPSTSSAPSPHTPPGAPDPTPSMGPSNSAHASSGEEVSGAALLTLVLKHLESGEVTEVPDLDMVLLATGRAPRTKGLGLEELGVQLNKKGGVEVDKFCTSVSAPWLHAIGDVSNRLNLTPVATMEGEVLAKNLFGLPPGVPPVAPDYDLVPTAVFTWPPFASVGLTEEAAVEKYGRVDVYVNTFRPLHASIASAAQTQATNMGEDRARSTDSNANGSNGQAAPKDGNGAATGVSADGSGDKGNAPSKNDPAVGEQGFVKVLVDGSGSEKIVGVHMVAPEAPDIMTGVALALKLGATKAQLDSVVGIHPTVGEELVTMKQLTRTSIKQEKEEEGKEEERGNDGGKRKEGEKEQAKVTG